MVRLGTASTASSVLTHVLLNSGESRCYLPPVSDRRALRLTRTLIRRGGVELSRSYGTYATLHHGRGGLVLTLGKDALPLMVSGLVLGPNVRSATISEGVTSTSNSGLPDRQMAF